MPWASRPYCLAAGCRERVTGGYCATHQRTTTTVRDRWRGSAASRGYDSRWVKLRNWFMSQPDNQLCRLCLAEGRVTRATDADHIVPFAGLDDPRRLDPSDLQPICRPHHRAKTRAEMKRGL